MVVKQIPCGGDRNYGYLIIGDDGKSAACVDPSPDPRPLHEQAEKKNVQIKYIINTHIHSDHTAGNHFILEKWGAELIAHKSYRQCDIGVKDSQQLDLGGSALTFFYTPGHTMDSICILAGDNLICGDTLFVGKVGGTYTKKDAEYEFESLKSLMKLDDDIRVLPGHNYGVKPESTIKIERETNPFCLRLNDFNEFVGLKENWAEYKKEHGIK